MMVKKRWIAGWEKGMGRERKASGGAWLAWLMSLDLDTIRTVNEMY
jgi:hypothetical protein